MCLSRPSIGVQIIIMSLCARKHSLGPFEYLFSLPLTRLLVRDLCCCWPQWNWPTCLLPVNVIPSGRPTCTRLWQTMAPKGCPLQRCADLGVRPVWPTASIPRWRKQSPELCVILPAVGQVFPFSQSHYVSLGANRRVTLAWLYSPTQPGRNRLSLARWLVCFGPVWPSGGISPARNDLIDRMQ